MDKHKKVLATQDDTEKDQPEGADKDGHKKTDSKFADDDDAPNDKPLEDEDEYEPDDAPDGDEPTDHVPDDDELDEEGNPKGKKVKKSLDEGEGGGDEKVALLDGDEFMDVIRKSVSEAATNAVGNALDEREDAILKALPGIVAGVLLNDKGVHSKFRSIVGGRVAQMEQKLGDLPERMTKAMGEMDTMLKSMSGAVEIAKGIAGEADEIARTTPAPKTPVAAGEVMEKSLGYDSAKPADGNALEEEALALQKSTGQKVPGLLEWMNVKSPETLAGLQKGIALAKGL